MGTGGIFLWKFFGIVVLGNSCYCDAKLTWYIVCFTFFNQPNLQANPIDIYSNPIHVDIQVKPR